MSPAVALDVVIKILVVALSAYPVLRPGAGHFEGKAMRVRVIVYPAVLALIPATWLVAGRPAPYPDLADIALGVPFLIDVIGNVFNLFATRRFDVIPHLFGWLGLTVAFGLAVAPLVPGAVVAFGLVLGFGATMDILWEIGEFTLMRSGSSGLQLTYENTIQDLATSLAGSALGALVVATILWPPAGTPATLFGWS